ncbi:hypothetical protein CROQUDRAFT_86796 [Cronartium quercuum f. sp. fusiforme G11]|uniref:Uncharacterized protein n=1 Tax=Cronartium quercuum f. sp. fusiforme G11 TaxID=708437 RepID=A0A9P6TH36_9BASI|nr:hypothetical protein CROQUDRAFT_86796 [Cronartium quercuum f. sp. fusiforme G11]
MDLIEVHEEGKDDGKVMGKIHRKKKGSWKKMDGKSPLEQALHICPWYLILDPLMTDRPHIKPASTCDSFGGSSNGSLVTDLRLNPCQLELSEDELARTPIESGLHTDDEESESGQAAEDVEGGSSRGSEKRPTSVFKFRRATKKAKRTHSRDTLGLHGLMSEFLPSRQERTAQAADEERRQANHMELTSKLADVIGSISANREGDLRFKPQIAQQEMKLKREQSRSDMVTKLMGQGISLETALAAASATFGDPEETGKSGKRVEHSEEEEDDLS